MASPKPPHGSTRNTGDRWIAPHAPAQRAGLTEPSATGAVLCFDSRVGVSRNLRDGWREQHRWIAAPAPAQSAVSLTEPSVTRAAFLFLDSCGTVSHNLRDGWRDCTAPTHKIGGKEGSRALSAVMTLSAFFGCSPGAAGRGVSVGASPQTGSASERESGERQIPDRVTSAVIRRQTRVPPSMSTFAGYPGQRSRKHDRFDA